MKKIFLTLILMCSLTSFAQENKTTKAIETVYNDIKKTSPQIKVALESLAKELKTTTDAIWIILVKQQKVWSYCYLILMFISVFNWITFYKKNYSSKIKYEKVTVHVSKIMQKEGATEEDVRKYSSYAPVYKTVTDEVLVPIPTSTISYLKYIHLFSCLIISVFTFFHFSDMMTGFINPEFGALKTVFEIVETLKNK